MPPSTMHGELTPELPVQGSVVRHDRPEPLDVDICENFEIGVVLSGGLEHSNGDLTVRLEPGGTWLSAAWEPQGWRVVRPGTSELVVEFIADFLGNETLGEYSWLAPFAAEPGERPQASGADVRREALAIAGDIERELTLRRRAWVVAVRLSVLRLLLTVCRSWRPRRDSASESAGRSHGLPRIMPAIRLLQASPSRRVGLEEAAAACGLSVSQFGSVFRQTMGVSFAKFCLRNRLGLAARRLLHTELPLEVIAAEYGFAHGSHLHRAFAKHYGCSPGQYRERGQAFAASPMAGPGSGPS